MGFVLKTMHTCGSLWIVYRQSDFFLFYYFFILFSLLSYFPTGSKNNNLKVELTECTLKVICMPYVEGGIHLPNCMYSSGVAPCIIPSPIPTVVCVHTLTHTHTHIPQGNLYLSHNISNLRKPEQNCFISPPLTQTCLF